MKILITCPPMLGMIDEFEQLFRMHQFEVTAPKILQVASEGELRHLLPLHDGWIVGDDIASDEILSIGKHGKLKALVKWGIGIDNIDIQACQRLDIPFVNTPNVFGAEVADLALGYIIALARETYAIDRSVREGGWYKPAGTSLAGKSVAIIGMGDIGKSLSKRLLACEMRVIGYDPNVNDVPGVDIVEWPSKIDVVDFIVVACSLTKESMGLINQKIFRSLKRGVRLVNVSRGQVLDEASLIEALETRRVHSAALDVFENEPLPINSKLRQFSSCIFGSHNSSNTREAVMRASERAVESMSKLLNKHAI